MTSQGGRDHALVGHSQSSLWNPRYNAGEKCTRYKYLNRGTLKHPHFHRQDISQGSPLPTQANAATARQAFRAAADSPAARLLGRENLCWPMALLDGPSILAFQPANRRSHNAQAASSAFQAFIHPARALSRPFDTSRKTKMFLVKTRTGGHSGPSTASHGKAQISGRRECVQKSVPSLSGSAMHFACECSCDQHVRETGRRHQEDLHDCRNLVYTSTPATLQTQHQPPMY